jgi:hypothetical protein
LRTTFLAITVAVVASVATLLGNATASVSQNSTACGPAPHKMVGKPALPPKFPTPAKVSYTSKRAGTTTIVSAFCTSGNLTAIHHAYSKALKAATPSHTKSKTQRTQK